MCCGPAAVAFWVWASPEKNPFFMIPAISLIQRGHMPPPDPPPAPGLFSMADPGRVKGLLRDAGFAQAQVEEVPLTFPVPNADGYLEFMADTAASASRRSSRPPANTFVVTRRGQH